MATRPKQIAVPALLFKYDTIYLIILLTIVLHMCSICYSMILFSVATNIKSNLGDYLSMVTDDGFMLAFLMAIPPTIIVILDTVCIVLLVRVIYDNKYKRAGLNQILFVSSIVCLVSASIAFLFSIIALMHSHTRHAKLHDGIRDAMDNYALDSTVKGQMDRMQIMFQCCGSKTYTEWYEIRWFDMNFIDNTTKLFGGEVPFSCCSMRASGPCIHHGIENTMSIYMYNPETNISISTHGCHEVLVKRKMSTSWSIFGLLFICVTFQVVLGIGMRIIQTAHSEFGRIEDVRHEYKAWILKLHGKERVERPKIEVDY